MKDISPGGRFRMPPVTTQTPTTRAKLHSGATLPVSSVSQRKQRQHENLPDQNEELLNVINQLVDSLDDGKEQKQATPRLKNYSFHTYRRCFWQQDVFRLVRVEVKNGREISVSFVDVASPSVDTVAPCNVPPAPFTDSK